MIEQIETSGVSLEVVTKPRLTIVLHPNPSCIDIALNDRMFNTERYSFSRTTEPVGGERELLDYCDTYIVGISNAGASKNTLRLEIQDGVLLREFIPQVITAVKRWASATEPYEPEIYVDNRRYEVDPVYGEWSTISEGIRELPGQADIGLPYSIWKQGR